MRKKSKTFHECSQVTWDFIPIPHSHAFLDSNSLAAASSDASAANKCLTNSENSEGVAIIKVVRQLKQSAAYNLTAGKPVRITTTN